jgi:hypothetical protein
MAKNAPPFVVVWKKALRDAAMPIGRKSFGAWLETWADRDGTNIWPTITTLADLGYSKRPCTATSLLSKPTAGSALSTAAAVDLTVRMSTTCTRCAFLPSLTVSLLRPLGEG